jgi:hypothetical protein
VSRWILCTWNGEIPLIFELPLGFSVVEELGIISSRECRNVIVVHVEVKGGASVSGCGFGLTMLAVVVVEMQGEISHQWEIWWRSQWGECYGVPGSSDMPM